MFGRANAHSSRPRPLRETGPPPRDNSSFWSPLRQPPPSTLFPQATEASANIVQPQRLVRNATVMTLHSDSESDEGLADVTVESQGCYNESDNNSDENEDGDDLGAAARQRALDLHENDDHFPWHTTSHNDFSSSSSSSPASSSSSNKARLASSASSSTTPAFTEKGTAPRRSYFTNQFDQKWDRSEDTSSDEETTGGGSIPHTTATITGQNSRKKYADAQQYPFDQPIFGDYLLTPMGFDEEDEFLRNPTGQGTSGSGTAAQQFPTSVGLNEFDESDQIGLRDNGYQVVTKNRRRDQERILENKRRQGRLLLVSLLDNFCLLYDQSPERNRKLFYVICKSLSNMGIIDEEYLEEMSAVRSSYQRAFRQLVLSALTSIKQEQLILESRRIMAPPSTPTSDGNNATDISRINARLTEPMSAQSSSSHHRHHLAQLHSPSMATSLFNDVALDLSEFPTTAPLMRTFSFGDMFDNDPTRYKHDFVEIKRLGRGGFASVYKARNKLDGIEYAIKKVRLRGGAKMRYEKIFREIKFLARLDHKNVVRYYSSWLEHADYPLSSTGKAIDDENEYGDDDDEYEDGTYATGDGDPSTRPARPFHRPVLQERRHGSSSDNRGKKGRKSSVFEHSFESSQSAYQDELSMGIVFGTDQSLDFSSRSEDQDMSLSIGFEEEDGGAGIEMEKTESNSTVTGRDIPRRTPLSTLSPGHKHHHSHKSPSVSLEMEGRVPSWGRSEADDTSEQDEDEEEEVEEEEDADEYHDSAFIGKLATSSRTSSSIEEIQRSLPSSLNDSSLGSRSSRSRHHQHPYHQQQDLDSIDEIDTQAMASYPPRPDVHLANDPLGIKFDQSWAGDRMVQPMQHPQRQLPSRHHQQHRQQPQPLFTRELTLFIQMQLCQTTLQDYLRFRNDQRGETVRRSSMASMTRAPATATAKSTHGKLRNDRFGTLSSLAKSGIDIGSPTAHAQSAPGSPLESPSHHNNDLVDPAVNQAIFRAIVEGVAYIHDQDMIHRDLKPGNIFLSVPPGMDLEQLLQESVGYQHSNGSSTNGSQAEDESKQLAMWDTGSNGGSREHGQHGFFGGLPSPSLMETLPIEKVQEVLFQNVEMLIPIIGDFGLVTDMDGSLTGSGTTSVGQTNLTGGTSLSSQDQEQQQQPQPQRDDTPPISRRSSNMTTASSRARTTAIGTVTYASPEQLARPNLGYDQKADIYSLGIIYFELYYPFSTLMERHAVLRTLRNGELPSEFVSRWPKEAAFVLWLMADDPAMRPTAREILDFDLIRKVLLPSPAMPKTAATATAAAAVEDPMDKAGRALLPIAGDVAESTTTTATTGRQGSCKTVQAAASPFSCGAGSEKENRAAVAVEGMEPMQGLNLCTGRPLDQEFLTKLGPKTPSPSPSPSPLSSLTRLLTAEEAVQVARSLPVATPALYFSYQPICERCQTHCRCEDVDVGRGQAQVQGSGTRVAKVKAEEAEVMGMERGKVKQEQHMQQQQEYPPIDQEYCQHHEQQQQQKQQQQQQQQQDPSPKPELRRRSSKRKSTSHQPRKPSHDASDSLTAVTSPLTFVASAGMGGSGGSGGGGGGVSLEAKLKRMEQSLAAVRLENKALLDRIQQLEYEKAVAWNPALLDGQNGTI
ncbi:hypothetical protein DFQ27_009132 [Actinomortierella ambigua]|uniref:Eukaryotic translation initiation factor 2-alpha kinase 1 n=1 Tax=Actinomortierella ambigua TaxID=1343610 RepID=A0A9P6PS17_9FUNG|nr:hypothetical protein DFQ27_009132 [Actinomortierella ambigua]